MAETEEISCENSPLTKDEKKCVKTEQRRIYKNILTISFTFMLTFMSYVSLHNLQSSLNVEGGIGLASLCVTHACLVMSSFLFAPLMISLMGCKWTIVSCTLCYTGFAAANFYPTWYTMMPSSAFVGLAAGPLWSAKCSYLTSSAIAYAKLMKKPVKHMVSSFFGIFFAFFVTGQLLGNIIMSLVLKPDQKQGVDNGNYSMNFTLVCGADDCPSSINSLNQFSSIKEPSRASIYILMSIFVCATFVAALPVLVFVDQIEVFGSEERDKGTKSKILAPLQQFKDVRMMLFSPLIVFEGMMAGFNSADFTKSYLACSFGVSNVGFVLISFATTRGILSSLIGKIIVCTGRKILIFIAGALNLTLLLVLRFWKPDVTNQVISHVVAGFFGICAAIWNTQINAYLGTLFSRNQEAAFANLRICQSIGFVISFAYGNYLCVSVKIYILITLLIVSLALYFLAEVVHARIKRNDNEAVELTVTNELSKQQI